MFVNKKSRQYLQINFNSVTITWTVIQKLTIKTKSVYSTNKNLYIKVVLVDIMG